MRTTRRQISGLLALAALALAVAAPPALAQEGPPAATPEVEPTPAEAADALADAEATLAGETPAGEAEPPDATLALQVLAQAMPVLEGAERRRAADLLARPTDDPDPDGETWSVDEHNPPFCSGRFCVHWVDTSGDAPDLTDAGGAAGVPDYVERVWLAAEQSYTVQNGSLDWPLPPSDGLRGGDARIDIYLAQIGNDGLFGYAATDRPQSCVRKCFSYLVMDDDYEDFGVPDPELPMRVTMAHEYNHVVQFGIDTLQDLWLFEATATWMEDKVFPDDDDYLRYIGEFASSPGSPITAANAVNGLRVYGTAVWNHWLESGAGGDYGPDVVRSAWLASDDTEPTDFAVDAYDLAIAQAGGRGFERDFVAFAADTAEWRAGAGGFPDAAEYEDVKRQGKLEPGAKRSFDLDHTAYRLLRVEPGNAGKLKLRVRAEDGVRSGLALVARDDDTATIKTKVSYLGKGGGDSLRLGSAQAYERITAVAVNADARIDGFAGNDWDYRKDNRGFLAELKRG